MTVGTRLRFEVLRRDSFRCYYCGASPDRSELHVDHVVAKALGGSDKPENLVSSCQECNSGKASTALDAPAIATVNQQAIEYRDAIRLAAEALADRRSDQARALKAFREAWEARAADHGATTTLEPGWETSLVRFLELGIPEAELNALARVAVDATRVPDSKKWRYFCGCCWRSLDELRETALSALAPADTAGSPDAKRSTTFAQQERDLAEAQALSATEAARRVEHLAELHPVFSEFIRTGEISVETQQVAETVFWVGRDRVLELYFAIGEPRGPQANWPQQTRWSPEPVGIGGPDGLPFARVPVAEVLYNPGTEIYRLSPTLVGREIRPESCAVVARVFGGNSNAGSFWEMTKEDIERYANPPMAMVCKYDPSDPDYATIIFVDRFWMLREHELPDDHWSTEHGPPQPEPVSPPYQKHTPISIGTLPGTVATGPDPA